MSIAKKMLLVLGAWISISCVFVLDAWAQKPVRESEVIVDGQGPPASLAEMARSADGIVVARYTGRSRLIPRGSPEGLIGIEVTSFAFEVTETVKGLLPVGDELEVRMIGGDQERSDHIRRTRVAGTDPLRPGHQYVVFLTFNPVRNELRLAWGAAGLYDVTTSTVRGVERQRRLRDGESVTAFLEALRSAAIRQRARMPEDWCRGRESNPHVPRGSTISQSNVAAESFRQLQPSGTP
jgi:hypothetical protein